MHCRLCRVLLLFLAVALVVNAAAQTPGEFTVIAVPDTQNEAQYYPPVMTTQMQWIANNAKSLNLQFVIGLGDIVNNGSDRAQYQNADTSYKVLDQAGVPYVAPVGNHDYANATPMNRDTTVFDNYFGPARYAAKSYYQGSFPAGSNANFYSTFTVNGTPYLVLALEFIPRDPVVDWASKVLSLNADKKVILMTHGYLTPSGWRQGLCDGNSARSFGLDGDNDAPQLWDKLIRQYPNIIMVMNGHDGGAGRRADLGDNGNLVNQIEADYQDEPNGGNAWIRIYTFKPALNQVDVKTYSPYLNQYKTDAANQFTVPISNPGTSSTTGSVSGLVRDGNCNGVSGVTISAGGNTTTTGGDGSYHLTTAPGAPQTVVASGGSWTTNSQTVRIDAGYDAQLHFFLATQGAATGSIAIASPASGSAVTSPVTVNATGTSSAGVIAKMDVYVDDQLAYTASGPSVNTALNIGSGGHKIMVQGTDAKGNVFKQPVNILVNSTGILEGTPLPTPPTQPAPGSSSTTSTSSSSSSTSPSSASSAPAAASPAADFAFDVASQGGKQYQVTITPSNGFHDQVSLSCSGLPAGMGCTFSPASLTPTSGVVTGTLTVTSGTASLAPARRQAPLYGALLPFSAMTLAGVLGANRRKLLLLLAAIAIAVSCMVAVGCGGSRAADSTTSSSSSATSQSATTAQTLTVVASSGTLRHTTTISVPAQ